MSSGEKDKPLQSSKYVVLICGNRHESHKVDLISDKKN